MLMRPEVSAVHLVAAPWQRKFVQDSDPCADTRFHLHLAPIGNDVLSRNLWFYSRLPKLAAKLDADIVHLAYPVPVRRGAFHCPTVVTLHDLYPYDIPDNFGFPKVLFNRAILRSCLRRVDAIACVSQSVRCGIESLDRGLAHKATVVYNSVEQPPRPVVETPLPEWEGWAFLLCVAQHRRNKNILLALRVFERLLRTNRIAPETRLLIVGIPGPETSSIQQFVAAAGLTNRVFLVSGISDDRLHWCYRNCSLLLAPSIIEGFGLPVAEALLAGCRLVCSDITAFRELGGSHCHYVPLGPREEEAFADAVRDALGQPSPEPVALPQFSAHAIAEEYMRLYRSLLPEPSATKGSRRTPFLATAEGRHPQ
jgi:glycosyltransferase involved in cell wall biosynthesis